MNDNQVAIELLARQIVQNVREILEENNRDVVAKQIKNVSVDAGNVKGLSKTVSQQVKVTKFPANQIIGLDEKVGEEVEAKFGTVTIKAAQIEDLNAEVAKITEAEIEKATITSAQIQDLEAEVAKIAAAEIESATIDTAQIKELSVKVAEIVVATIDEADIKWADIDNLTAAIANITSANIKDARIDFAQIDGLVAGQALITEAVGGKVVIKDLSVTDANIVDLNANKINAGTIAVERLVIVGSDKSIVYTINEANGTAQLSQTTIDGGSITRKTITADQIVAKGITAENLDVAEIFANEALIGVITSQHLATGSVTAGSIAAGAVEADKIKAGAVNTDKLAASAVTADKIAAGAVEADKIKAGAISAEKLAANAVTADKIASGSVEADKIKSGAITADKIAANTITANKLASDVGSSLDLSSNKSINLRVDTLQKELEASVSDATGQQMTISFSQGNAIEEERKSITASAHIWKSGEEITDQIPAQAFSWMMEGGNGGVWYGVKEVTLSREDIGKSCQLRCILDEAGSFGTFEIVDGDLILTRPDTGVTDAFSLSDGILYGEEHYTLEDGMLSRNAASNKMQVTTSVFDHSVLETSHILIKDKVVDIRSGGNINIQAGGSLTMAASALKLTAATTLEDELQGNAQAAQNAQNTANNASTAASNAQTSANAAQEEAAAIKQRVVDLEAENGEFAIKILDVEAKANEIPSELVNTAMTLNGNGIEMTTAGHFRLYANDGKNSMIKLGGDDETANFSVTETGKLGAISGEFTDGLKVRNYPVWTRQNIIISSSQPTNVHDVLWIRPLQGVQQTSHSFTNDGSYHFNSGEARSYTLTPQSNDVLTPGGSYEYSLSFPMTLGTNTSSPKTFTVSAVISNASGSVTLTGQAVSLWGWGNVDIKLTGTSSVNLCASSGNITAAVTVSGGGGGNTSMYIPGEKELILTSKNTAASAAGAQTCAVHYIP